MISSEQELAQALAVSVAQLRFTLCLFASIPVCWLQAQIRSALSKNSSKTNALLTMSQLDISML